VVPQWPVEALSPFMEPRLESSNVDQMLGTQLLVFPLGPRGQSSVQFAHRRVKRRAIISSEYWIQPRIIGLNIRGVWSRSNNPPAVLTSSLDTSIVVPLRSSSCRSPDLVLARPFPSVLTSMAFVHSRRRWFGTCPADRFRGGLPSSVKQLHTTQPFGLSRSWRTFVGNPYLIG